MHANVGISSLKANGHPSFAGVGFERRGEHMLSARALRKHGNHPPSGNSAMLGEIVGSRKSSAKKMSSN